MWRSGSLMTEARVIRRVRRIPGRKTRACPTGTGRPRRTPRAARSVREREPNALDAQLDVQALGHAGELDDDAVLIPHRRHAPASTEGTPDTDGRVRARELAQ